MKYIGELSLAWLVILAFYAAVPATVDARALDGDTYIAERETEGNSANNDGDADDNLTISADELYSIVEMALESYLNKPNSKLPNKLGASSLWNRPMDNLANGFTGYSGSKRSRDSYARAALKRNMKDELRNELSKKSFPYRSPVDLSGGSLLGHGTFSGIGR